MISAMPEDYSLSEEQKQHFLEHGFIKLENCFSLEDEQCKKLMDRVWERLDMDPNDKETWIHLPRYHNAIPMRDFCPKAWSAICELCGGEDRIDTSTSPENALSVINDGFIVNVGSKADALKWTQASSPNTSSNSDNLTPAQEKLLDPHDRDNWHVDGDFFHHFLDSKEQALLPIVLFGDIKVGGGGTMICPDAIATMAKHLAAHPEGLMLVIFPFRWFSRVGWEDDLPTTNVIHTCFSAFCIPYCRFLGCCLLLFSLCHFPHQPFDLPLSDLFLSLYLPCIHLTITSFQLLP
ncbi:hypothetical protein D6C92_00636 [Aureobasidium pullulans]|nr:hypothetical protein D6C92_00636 [Aureobasidium pullulans]